MGVPKFYRWLSERYPRINQRFAAFVNPETYETYFPAKDGDEKNLPPPPLEAPDPLSTCGLSPEIDRLYIDMNGVLHGCSHNNAEEGDEIFPPTNQEIFTNVCYYLDRIVGDIAKPKQMVYMAIDGVAPRAKLNQQRSRRYRGGNSELEKTIYDEILLNMAQQKEQKPQQSDIAMDHDGSISGEDTHISSSTTAGRWSGKFEAQHSRSDGDVVDTIKNHILNDTPDNRADMDSSSAFQSNTITPGTVFFQECMQHLEHWLHYKLSTDPKWQHLEIVLSGCNVPGEGEHKIMSFMREQRSLESYDPNLRHCIVGQDGDLVMLGLATHEPNLVLLRERVVFDANRRMQLAGIDSYLHNIHFEWFHLSILRDYLMYDLETPPAVPDSPFCRERTLDDFVFLTFLVGNDFLPPLPALDIADEAFDLLFHHYKRQRWHWLSDKDDPNHKNPYLTEAGTIVSGSRLEDYLSRVGAHETTYYDKKRERATSAHKKMRKQDNEAGREPTIPSEETLQAKETADRAKYRAMLQKTLHASEGEQKENGSGSGSDDEASFQPVVSTSVFRIQAEDESDDLETGYVSRMGELLQQSLSPEERRSGRETTTKIMGTAYGNVWDDQDLKGRYYYDKFGFSPLDADKHTALRKAYLEGLVWNLKYYYEGCVSWEWFYPYHYGPMMSDLVNVDELLAEISFGDAGEPLKPFEQLMGCMPPSSATLLPEPYQWLLTDPASPIADFYPTSFTVDMNGKRWPWEAVVLLPFIDSQRLVSAANTYVKEEQLTDDERARNQPGQAVVFSSSSSSTTTLASMSEDEGSPSVFGALQSTAQCVPLSESQWHYEANETTPVFQPKLLGGAGLPSTPGFPSLTAAPIRSLRRSRLGINVHGMRSRYRTAVLDLEAEMPPFPPLQLLASKLIGSTIHINYPFLTEGFVTAMSNASLTIRGGNGEYVKHWTTDEADDFRRKLASLVKHLEVGARVTGTGGWKIPDGNGIVVSVRPLKGLTTMPDGTVAKVYATFEVDVPLMAALWSPDLPDPRIADIPAAFEKDPYFIEMVSKASGPSQRTTARDDSYRSGFLQESIGATRNFGSLSHRLSQGSRRTIQPTTFKAADSSRSLSSLAIRRRHSTQVRGSPRGRLMAMGVALGAALFGKHAAGTQLAAPALSRPRPTFLNVPRGGDSAPSDPFAKQAPPPLDYAHGTTTLSFKFSGGIIAAVDSRASMGEFVGSKTTQKVLPINSHMIGTMAGGAADCSYWIRKIKGEAQFHELNEGRRMSVARASRLLSDVLYEYRGFDLSVGTMIMGFDDDADGVCDRSSIYYVDNSGVRIKGDMFAVGSGSTYAQGILDEEYHFDMSEEEAIALGIKAIRHATFRDAGSGGFIGVYLLTSNGWTKVFAQDLAPLAPPNM